jgi:hypothetical protein
MAARLQDLLLAVLLLSAVTAFARAAFAKA